jgi:hypothetical protein
MVSVGHAVFGAGGGVRRGPAGRAASRRRRRQLVELRDILADPGVDMRDQFGRLRGRAAAFRAVERFELRAE